ncbi:MAG: hypothetical protein HC831_09855, partial [Chloroflexia bacterium]|nr:hypothetical protein [Chloroflexia bacterium]
MKLRILLFLMMAGLLWACEKNEDSPNEESKITIDGKEFTPTESTIIVSGKQLSIVFSDGTNEVKIVTNDTIEGTYNIVTEQLKASTLKANIEYTDGTNTYKGTSGTVVLQKSDQVFSGSYNATLESVSDNSEIEISGGSFSDIESTVEVLIANEASINDSLLLYYDKFNEFIQFEFIFDAVYSNQVNAPNSTWTDIYGHTQDASK